MAMPDRDGSVSKMQQLDALAVTWANVYRNVLYYLREKKQSALLTAGTTCCW